MRSVRPVGVTAAGPAGLWLWLWSTETTDQSSTNQPRKAIAIMAQEKIAVGDVVPREGVVTRIEPHKFGALVHFDDSSTRLYDLSEVSL